MKNTDSNPSCLKVPTHPLAANNFCVLSTCKVQSLPFHSLVILWI